MKNLGLVVVMMLFVGFGFSQSKQVEIKTSAQCEMCKKRIEDKLNYTKGVKFVELDVASKVLTVKFNTSKITDKEVKDVVASIGYHADDVKRNEQAHSKLPGCCKSNSKATAKSCCSGGKKTCSKDVKKATPAKSCCSKDGKKSCSKKK